MTGMLRGDGSRARMTISTLLPFSFSISFLFLPHPACVPPLCIFPSLLLPFTPPPTPSSLTPLPLPLSLSLRVPPSPLLSASCSAEISAEAPVRLSGDRDGGSDITAPSADCQPSAVAMATTATARGAEAGDETPAVGGRGGEGECVRNISFISIPSSVSPLRLCRPRLRRPFLVDASRRAATPGIQG